MAFALLQSWRDIMMWCRDEAINNRRNLNTTRILQSWNGLFFPFFHCNHLFDLAQGHALELYAWGIKRRVLQRGQHRRRRQAALPKNVTWRHLCGQHVEAPGGSVTETWNKTRWRRKQQTENQEFSLKTVDRATARNDP